MSRQHAFLLDEHVAERVGRKLRRLGHSVVRVRSQRGKSVPDEEVLALAHALKRAVVTRDWNDYLALHEAGVRHEGIFICRGDEKQLKVAEVIHETVKDRVHLTQQLFRVIG